MDLTKSAATTSSNTPLSALITMFYEPGRAFSMLEPKRHAWLPLVLLIVATSTLLFWYFNVVDFAWLLDQMLAGIKDAEQRDMTKTMMSKTMMTVSAVGGSVVMFPIACALAGVYFMLAGKVLNKEVSFGTGFALAAWASVPALLLLPLGAVAIMFASNGQLNFSDLNPLSLNQLIFHYDMAHPMAALLDNLNASSIWTMILTMIGFQVWARTPRSTAIVVVLIPYLTIYGIWFAFAMSKAA
jgi:hypothetical protein